MFVPGFGGSWNNSSMLTCGTVNIGDWILNPLAKSTYVPFYDAVTSSGLTILPFYYDFRKPVSDNGLLLQKFIDANTQPNEKIYLVGHSMGGLVMRSYLNVTGNEQKVYAAAFVGSPQQGLAIAYPAWSAGDRIGPAEWKLAQLVLEKHCGGLSGKNRETIQTYIPSIRDLLPIYPYLKQFKIDEFISIPTMSAKNTWLLGSPLPVYLSVRTGTLSGHDRSTIDGYIVDTANKNEVERGDWLDGKPKNPFKSDGDGTVSDHSSILTNAINETINGDHGQIVATPRGINKIFSLLGLSYQLPEGLIPYTPEQTGLLILSSDADITVTDPSNTKIDTDTGIAGKMNYQRGKYRVYITHKGTSSTIEVYQSGRNGKLSEKSYIVDKKTKFLDIFLDPDNPN